MKKEVKVGLLGLFSCVILYFGFNFLKGEEFFSSQNKYHIRYSDIDGLSLGNPVILNGFTVGKVTEIELEQDNADSLLVTIGVKSSIVVGDSTVALLANNGLLEGKAIMLKTGINTYVYEGGEILTPGVEPSIAKMIEDRAIPVIANLDSVIDGLDAFVNAENQKNLQESFAAMNRTIQNFEKTSYQVKQMVYTNKENFNTITANMKSLTDSLNMLTGEFHPILTKLNTLADSLNDLELKETLNNMNEVLVNMESITHKIDSGQGSIGKFVNEDSLAISMNQAMSDLDSLFVDIKEHPSRYVHVSVFGKKDKTKKKKKK